MVFALMIIAPYIWMMLTSFKSTREVLYNPGKVMPIKWTLSGYITVLTKSPFFSWFKNSVIVSVAVTAAVIFTSTITGYVFSKYRFKGKNILFWLVLSTMMVPSQITMLLSRYCFIKKNTTGDATDGRNSGISEFLSPIACIWFTNPTAEICVGIVIISRMMVKAAFLNLKS